MVSERKWRPERLRRRRHNFLHVPRPNERRGFAEALRSLAGREPAVGGEVDDVAGHGGVVGHWGLHHGLKIPTGGERPQEPFLAWPPLPPLSFFLSKPYSSAHF